MQKITITLDLARIDKNRINNRIYTNKNGEEVTVKEYQLDVVELQQPKNIKEGDTWILQQTHFVTDAPTKEERQAQIKMNALGKGTGFVNKTNQSVQSIKKDISSKFASKEVEGEDDYSSIPF